MALLVATVAGSWGGGAEICASKICSTASLDGSIGRGISCTASLSFLSANTTPLARLSKSLGRGIACTGSLSFLSANATPFARLSKSSMSWLLSPSGSVLVASMPATISLTASRVSSSKLVFCLSSSKLPSRIFPSKVSPA